MFFLAGPTAIGKSEIAVEVARHCGAEIIGADAFQIYKGLDLLTAKPSEELREMVPHHLIGEIPLAEKFDVARYRELALVRAREIETRGERVLVTGGTGLYIRALMRGLSNLPEADAGLRRELEALTLNELQEKYAALDPAGMERIDRQNRRRLVRAIEVSLLAKAPYSSLREDWSGHPKPPQGQRAQGVLLERDREDLYRRIDDRVRRMFAGGVVDEVRAAGEVGHTAAQAIGYSEIQALLRGEKSVEECITAIQLRTRRYAKRQLTWFRSENIFFTVNLTKISHSEAADLIAQQCAAAADGGSKLN